MCCERAFRGRLAVAAMAFAAVLMGSAARAGAESAPQPPCGGPPFPPYPEVDGAPAVKVWDRSDWTPPSCTSWSASASSTLVATAGRFHFTVGVEGLRRRIGAISELAGMVYWSVTNQQWQPLIVAASALDGPSEDQRRKDFSPQELAEGRTLYAEEEDNLLGKAIYRVRIVSASSDRLVFATENSSPIRRMGIPLFPAGEIQSICFLEREGKDVWRYYSVARMGKQASLLSAGHEESLVNRAVAWYRHVAGLGNAAPAKP